MNLLASRRGRLTAFFFLYMTEGIPLGFTATAVATQMRRQGVSPAEVSIFVGWLYFPWALKWVVGPFVDNFSIAALGRRRSWILLAQLGMALTLLAGTGIPFSEVHLFTLLIIVHNCFGATQDVAIDALACGTLEERERGLANGLMFGGAYLGQTVGGAGVLYLSTVLGFEPTFFVVAGAILVVTALVTRNLREPAAERRAAPGTAAVAVALRELRDYVRAALRAFFGSRAARVTLIFALLPSGGYALSLALQTNLAVELGLTDVKIATLNLYSTVLSAGGCVLGGFLSDRLGRRKMLAVYVVATVIPGLYLADAMQGAGWILPVDPQATTRPLAPDALVSTFWMAVLGFSVVHGLMYGTRIALYMDVSNPAIAATQFTAYMALLNLVISYSGWWQGPSMERWGYPTTLVLDSALGVLGLLLLPFVRRPE